MTSSSPVAVTRCSRPREFAIRTWWPRPGSAWEARVASATARTWPGRCSRSWPRPVAPRHPAADPAVGLPAGGRVGWRRISAVAVGWTVPPRRRWSRWPRRSSGWSTTCDRDDRGLRRRAGSVGHRRERLRDVLADACCPTGPTPPRSPRRPRRAGWALPAEAAVILLSRGRARPRHPRPDDAGLPGSRRTDQLPAAIAARPRRPGRRQRLLAALRGDHRGRGPTVPLDQLPESVRVAEAAVRPSTGRRSAATRSWRPTTSTRSSCTATGACSTRCGPTSRAARPPRPGRGRRCSETLRSWLVHMGNRGPCPRSSACTRRRCATGSPAAGALRAGPRRPGRPAPAAVRWAGSRARTRRCALAVPEPAAPPQAAPGGRRDAVSGGAAAPETRRPASATLADPAPGADRLRRHRRRHHATGRALEAAVRERWPDAVVDWVDTLDVMHAGPGSARSTGPTSR